METGAVAVSLAARDNAATRQVCSKLGVTAMGGGMAQQGLLLKTGATVVGLGQGLFEKNLLTFNPRWDSAAAAPPHVAGVCASAPVWKHAFGGLAPGAACRLRAQSLKTPEPMATSPTRSM